MGVPHFIEHRSERLNMLVRGANHPPPPPSEAVTSLEAGLYVTVLIYGGVELQCADMISTPRSTGMLVFAVREEVPWIAHGQATHLRAVGATMYRPDLRVRGLDPGSTVCSQARKSCARSRMPQIRDAVARRPRYPLRLLCRRAGLRDVLLQAGGAWI
ncbi:hypothetical protein [Paracoccus sp. (in: a-proteobacteria)]|uniref:hypothetical protein n=1 Tax=Paracoccus sp. TaxID=267 RepID=UPI002AFEEA8A|nr:hypothetical protein [Paracoccus sp. (in: a-proteobacteria)]